MLRTISSNSVASLPRNRAHILAAGLVIGSSASIFPACGNVFTDPASYNFSAAQYGSLFVAQTLLAISSSLISPKIKKLWSERGLLRLALISCVAAMLLLASIALLPDRSTTAYLLTLTANVFMGFGIGGGISIANVLAARAWPDHQSRGVAALHTMLGGGLAFAPLGLSVCVAVGYWWLMPLLIGGTGLWLSAMLRVPQQSVESRPTTIAQGDQSIGKPLILLGSLALLYGLSEATFSNWCVIYLHEFAGVSVASAGLVLSGFWGAVMLGRLAFAASSRASGRVIAIWSPLVTSLVFVLISQLPAPAVQIAGFILAGLSCAAVYPFLLGHASQLVTTRTHLVSGIMVATVLAGTGGGTFLTSLLNRYAGLPLNTIFLLTAVVPLFILVGMRSRFFSVGHVESEYRTKASTTA